MFSANQNPSPSGQPRTGTSATQGRRRGVAEPGQGVEGQALGVGGRIEDDLRVRPGRPSDPGRCHGRPRNSSIDVASATGDSNIG
jgi:hypothetical protein